MPLRLDIFVSFTLTVEVKRTKRLVTQYHHIIEAASRVPRYPSRILNEPSFLYYVKQARETTMKPSLLFAVFLLFASSAQAQHHHQNPSAGSGQGFINGWGGTSGGGIEYGSGGRHLRYEPPRDFEVSYARNDGPFVPSTYMNYNDALALGQQQLAAAVKAEPNDSGPSLGDAARAFRAAKIPTLRLQSRVLQDNSGNLEICNLNGNNCHRP